MDRRKKTAKRTDVWCKLRLRVRERAREKCLGGKVSVLTKEQETWQPHGEGRRAGRPGWRQVYSEDRLAAPMEGNTNAFSYSDTGHLQ